MEGFADDLRITFVIAKNEMKKHLRGRRIIIFAALLAVIFVAITAAFVLLGDGLGDDPERLAGVYLAVISLMIIIGATLFAASSLVSEFTERTALILFTRPVRRWSIFVGKMLSSVVLLIVFVAIYYALLGALCIAGPGSLPSGFVASLGYAACYCFATVGIAMLVSSLMKTTASASILTFFLLALLLDMVMTIIALAAGLDDTWYMLNTAASAIVDCLGVDITGEDVAVDGFKAAGTMLAWGIVPAALGLFRFSKRDF